MVHFYDFITDVLVLNTWFNQRNDPNITKNVNIIGLFIGGILTIIVYRIVSCYLIYYYTQDWKRIIIQLLDLEILRTTYISHITHSEEMCNLQHWLQKLEAIFESLSFYTSFHYLYIICTLK